MIIKNRTLFIKKCVVLVIIILFFSIFLNSITAYNFKNPKLSIFDPPGNDFDKKIHRLMRRAHIPSLVACIVDNDTVIWTNAYGKYKYYQNKPATIDIVYPVGCMTKSIIATAIMQLNESGVIGLDDNVSEYLNFDLKNPKYPEVNITFRMILAHQSSLATTYRPFHFYYYWLNYSWDQLSEYFKPSGRFYHNKIWRNSPPGEVFHYNVPNFDLLGYIIEKITGQSLEDYCQENIFKPLDMKNTSFYFSSFNKNRVCGLYTYFGRRYFSWPIMDYGPPGGSGIKSTVLDLSHFLIIHNNGGVYNNTAILKDESVEEMHRIQYPDFYETLPYEFPFRYGLGWYYTKSIGDEPILENGSFKYYGHGGSHPGAHAVLKIRISDKVGIILLYNSERLQLRGRQLELDARYKIELAFFEKADELLYNIN
jgi:CubicO group peptidase (beta-lactamase class C family)